MMATPFDNLEVLKRHGVPARTIDYHAAVERLLESCDFVKRMYEFWAAERAEKHGIFNKIAALHLHPEAFMKYESETSEGTRLTLDKILKTLNVAVAVLTKEKETQDAHLKANDKELTKLSRQIEELEAELRNEKEENTKIRRSVEQTKTKHRNKQKDWEAELRFEKDQNTNIRRSAEEARTKHRRETAEMTTQLEEANIKAEKAATDLQTLKQRGQKVLDKQRVQLEENVAKLEIQDREIEVFTTERDLKSHELETTRQELAILKAEHEPSAKEIEALKLELKVSKALNKSLRGTKEMEDHRVQKAVKDAEDKMQEQIQAIQEELNYFRGMYPELRETETEDRRFRAGRNMEVLSGNKRAIADRGQHILPTLS